MQTQTRGLKETTTSIFNAISAAIAALRRNPELFADALEQAKIAIDVIAEGSEIISEGAEDLLVAASIAQKLSQDVFSSSRSIPSQPIGENHVVDIDTAVDFVKSARVLED